MIRLSYHPEPSARAVHGEIAQPKHRCCFPRVNSELKSIQVFVKWMTFHTFLLNKRHKKSVLLRGEKLIIYTLQWCMSIGREKKRVFRLHFEY